MSSSILRLIPVRGFAGKTNLRLPGSARKPRLAAPLHWCRQIIRILRPYRLLIVKSLLGSNAMIAPEQPLDCLGATTFCLGLRKVIHIVQFGHRQYRVKKRLTVVALIAM
jgi:hypothetical protein